MRWFIVPKIGAIKPVILQERLYMVKKIVLNGWFYACCIEGFRILFADEFQGYTIVEEKEESTCNGKIVEIDGKKYQLKEIIDIPNNL